MDNLKKKVYLLALIITISLAFLINQHIVFGGTGDSGAPTVTIQAPAEDQDFNTTSVPLNYTVVNTSAISRCWYNLDGGSNVLISGCANTTISGISNIAHNITVRANISSGVTGASSVINFTVNSTANNSAPNITITITNNSVIQIATPIINITCIDENTTTGMISEIKWNNTGYGKNSSTVNNTLTSITTNSSLSDGPYFLNATCSDGSLTGNSSQYNITIDTASPEIDFTTPTSSNAVNVSRTYIDVNVTLNETNFVNLTFRLFNSTGGVLNTTSRVNKSQTLINYTAQSDGLYYYNITIQDAASTVVTTSTRSITLDTITPSITIQVPLDSQKINSSSLAVNFSVNETNRDSCWYSIDSGTNTSITGCSNFTISPVANSTHNLTIYSNDSAGHIGQSPVVNFSMHRIIINYVSPTDNDSLAVKRNYTFINVTVTSPTNISACQLEWTNTTSNATNITMTMSANGTNIFCYYNQSVSVDGNYSYRVFANDSVNYIENSTNRTITIDTTSPFVSSSSPSGTITSSSTTLSATTNENASCKYGIDAGVAYANMTNNFTETNTTHTTVISGLTDGTKIYRVRCNDTLGNVNESDFNISFTVSIPSDTPTGGGGGSSCSYNWTCAEWSPDSCPVTAIQTRTCANKGSCRGTLGKPAESRSCEYTSPSIPIVENILPKLNSEETPVKICEEASKRCSLNSVEECKNNQWVSNQTCENGCDSNALSCKKAESSEKKEMSFEYYLYLAGLFFIIIILGWFYYHKDKDKKKKKQI